MSTLLRYKVAIAESVGKGARVVGRGGTSLPGLVLNRLEPNAISLISRRLTEGNAVISATNGKTTTAAMVASILKESGKTVVHNRSGANMPGGIAACLAAAVKESTRHSHSNNGTSQFLDSVPEKSTKTDSLAIGQFGLFEVDEFWLPPLVHQLQPRSLLLSNLFRDQLDRYGEIELIVNRWIELLASNIQSRLILNCDDPLIASLATETSQFTKTPIFFGIDDRDISIADGQHAADFKNCRRCGNNLRYQTIYLAHLGIWSCSHCDFSRPEPDVKARDISLNGTSSSSFTLTTPQGDRQIELSLPGVYNIYNALGAAALSVSLDISLDDISNGLTSVAPAFGRAETLTINERHISLLLIKNPTGANEVLRTLALDDEPLNLLVILNDRIADGRDISWIWDAEWELISPKINSVICSGTRANELALRLRYAGILPERLEVISNSSKAFDTAIDKGKTESLGSRMPLYVLPTYTAMLELQTMFASRGDRTEYWR